MPAQPASAWRWDGKVTNDRLGDTGAGAARARGVRAMTVTILTGDALDDDTYEDNEDPGADCGRWSNGRLGRHCALAGTEFCDFECPYRDAEAVKC